MSSDSARRRAQRRLSPTVAVLLILLLSACAESEPAPELPPRSIQWMRISDSAGQGERVMSGIVTAVSDTRLAFEVGGVVASVEVNFGDAVSNGQVLATLDPEPLELVVRDAEAQLAAARATFQDASVSFDRARSLFEQDVASEAERDRAQARYDSTQSAVEAADARLGLAQRDLRRSTLRAPFDGSISVRNIDPAQKVFSGQIAFEMDSGESGLRVEVQLPETLIARVTQGQKVDVTFPSISTDTYDAAISEVGTRAGDGNSFTVKADLVDRVEEIRPGMTAEVHFTYTKSAPGVVEFEGFMIPVAAVRQTLDGQMSVFVFDQSTSTVTQTPIVTGGTLDNELAVMDGLQTNAIIATAGVSFLSDGQTVRLLE